MRRVCGMEKTTHTPGDWRVSPISGHLMSGHAVIALRPIDRLPEQEANFALFAAAPELLAALLALTDAVETADDKGVAMSGNSREMVAARSAIAKAQNFGRA